MFLVKCLDADSILEFADTGWDTKVQDGITCNVQLDSVVYKYKIATQNFIMTFCIEDGTMFVGNWCH